MSRQEVQYESQGQAQTEVLWLICRYRGEAASRIYTPAQCFTKFHNRYIMATEVSRNSVHGIYPKISLRKILRITELLREIIQRERTAQDKTFCGSLRLKPFCKTQPTCCKHFFIPRLSFCAICCLRINDGTVVSIWP